MSSDTRLTDEFVVRDYDNDQVRGEEIRNEERPAPARARTRSRLASVLRSTSTRFRAGANATTADNRIASLAEVAAGSFSSLAETIEADGLRGIADRTTGFVKSHSRAVAAAAAGLGLLAVEAWRRGGRSRG